MAQATQIEWTDATWNPVTGCTKIGLGCDNCYAERFAERWRGVPDHPYEQGFDLRLWPSRIEQPIRWRKPRLIFVNSMSDLFHEDVPLEFIQRVFDVMNRATQHQFQVLTKRAERLEQINKELTWSPNIWMGVSIESSDYLYRIKHLRKTRAKIKFLSLEPLLGPLAKINLKGMDWVIVGGESVPGARPIKPHWVTDIRKQCLKANTPFFFKQWGGTNKKKAGRTLEGKTWNEMPELLTA